MLLPISQQTVTSVFALVLCFFKHFFTVCSVFRHFLHQKSTFSVKFCVIAKVLDALFYVCAYGYFSSASNFEKYWTVNMLMSLSYAVKAQMY